MIESRRQTGQWRRIAPPPGSTQSTSRLFCAAESEINRIVTLGAVPGRTLPRSKPERSPRLLNEVSTGIEYRLPPGSCRVRRWPVNYRKLTARRPNLSSLFRRCDVLELLSDIQEPPIEPL